MGAVLEEVVSCRRVRRWVCGVGPIQLLLCRVANVSDIASGDLQVHCCNGQWKKSGEDEGQINLKLEFGQEGKGREGKERDEISWFRKRGESFQAGIWWCGMVVQWY
jgi:hypothetical protein